MEGRRALKERRRIATATASVAAWVVAVTLAALACASGTDRVEPAAEAAWAPSVLSPRGGLAWRDYFPNVELTTHNGDRVRFYDDLIKGKVVVINFMYATCTDS